MLLEERLIALFGIKMKCANLLCGREAVEGCDYCERCGLGFQPPISGDKDPEHNRVTLY